MNLTAWAIKWGVSYGALLDLMTQMGTAPDHTPEVADGDDEQAVQTRVRLEASSKGARLWRNNVGACVDNRGNFVRYGLANDSKQVSKHIKSSDLIGLKPVQILPEHVGHVFGQFMAREVKRPGWTYADTERERAQLKFIELITSMGGDACFVTGAGSFD